MERRAVFLDRDGVINAAVVKNGKPYPPPSFQDFKVLPGVKGALRELRQLNLLTIIVTNQPDVVSGTQSKDVVEQIHDFIFRTLEVDDIKVCYCLEGPECNCYKPKPGMLFEAAKDWNINLMKSFIVGDRWRDIGAGKAAGCTTFFVNHNYTETMSFKPDFEVNGLAEATQIIARIK